MPKTILITGATDGIGLETAKLLAAKGHTLLLHGRNRRKLDAARTAVESSGATSVDTYVADLSDLRTIDPMASSILEKHPVLDVLINNAGVMLMRSSASANTAQHLDVHLAVNTVAPYRLTRSLQSGLKKGARVINLSSAAQAPVHLDELKQPGGQLPGFEAYSQSKLAITMWSAALAKEYASSGGPIVVAVNPGSMLGTKMVKEGFGVRGADIGIGAGVLVRAALSEEFEGASGKYFNNDAGAFGRPHRDALDTKKNARIVDDIEDILEKAGFK